MLAETIDDTMRLPLVVSDIDTDDDDDNSSDNTKENNDFKITQTMKRLVVLMTALVIIETMISQSFRIKEVLVWVRVDGGDKVNMVVFSTCSTVSYGYILLGLAGFFFFERLNRTYKKRFHFLTLLLLSCHVMLIILKSAVLFREYYK